MSRSNSARRLAAPIRIVLILAMVLACLPPGGLAAAAGPADAEISPPGPSERARAAKEAKDADFAADELIVRYAPGASAVVKKNADKRAGAVSSTGLGHAVPGLTKVRLRKGVSVESAIAAYERQPGVLYAEPNYKGGIDVVPNDPQYGSLWGLDNTGQDGGVPDADIDAPEAWDTTTGSSDVVVAVIDTGVDYTHPELADNMWTNPGEIPGNGVDDEGNGYVDDVYGIDTYNDDSDPFDDHSHGTHCSGTIGAVGNNGLGVVGVNWDVTIMAVKWIGADGMGWTDDAIEAIEYAYMMGADLSSNSWHIFEYSQAMYDTIAALDKLIVFAAGNESSNTDVWTNHPSAYDLPNILAVGASNRFDERAWFSNYGLKTVDVFAPGEDILSTVPGEGYDVYSGTSMATPHTAGVAALLLAVNPTASWQSLKLAIMGGSDKLPAFAGKCLSGGRLNADLALDLIAAENGSVMGTVTSAQTGDPIPGAAVSVGGTVSTLTGPDGTYAFPDVLSGEQAVLCSHPDYIAKVALVTIPPAGMAPLDIALDRAAKIAGTVTSVSSGLPVEGVQVTAYTQDEWGMVPAGQTFTASDGTYVIGGLTADPLGYRIEFYEPTWTFVSEFYNDKPSFEEADPVYVVPGEITSGVDAALTEFGRITGMVTAEVGGAPLADVWVTAYREYADGYWEPWTGTVTEADGTYSLGGLDTGVYRLEFTDMTGEHAYEFYDDAGAIARATSIDVTIGAVTSGIDAALGPAGKIAGTVTAAGDGSPIQYTYVTVYRNMYGSWYPVMFGAETAEDGSYLVGGLPSGAYRVEFNDWSGEHASEFYNDKPDLRSATALSVRAGFTQSGVDAALEPAGAISGTVTAADGGAPLENVWVMAYRKTGKYWEWWWDALTGPDGTYSIDRLPAGTYRLQFIDENGNYASEFYDGEFSVETADDITVVAGAVTSGIDASLDSAARISGTVTDAVEGTPLQGVWVTAYRKIGRAWMPWWGAETGSDGTYSIASLNAGVYRVEFFDPYYGHAYEFYDNASSLSLATDIAVTAGAAVSGIDAALEMGGVIAGTVTAAADGTPIQYLGVTVYRQSGGSWEPWWGAETGPDGSYTVTGLPTGTYRVEFYDWTGMYVSEFYDNKPTLNRATNVAVTVGTTTAGIDAALEALPPGSGALATPRTRPPFGPERWLRR